MSRRVPKFHPLSHRLVMLLVASAGISGGIFCILDSITYRAVYEQFGSSQYEQRRLERDMQSLHQFVISEHLSAARAWKLNQWVRRKRSVGLIVFCGNEILFKSPDVDDDMEFWMGFPVKTMQRFPLEFSDGTFDAVLIPYYRWHIYNILTAAEICLGFVLFLAILLFGIRGVIEYIGKLRSEVEILEGGNLDFSITLRGNDELTLLARGLDDMRVSLKERFDTERALEEKNRRMVCELSHDLRTPLTAASLYTDVLRRRTAVSAEQEQYLCRISARLDQLAQMADRLLAYSSAAEREKTEDVRLVSAREAFTPQLVRFSEMLCKNGFSLEVQPVQEERAVMVSDEFLSRILDNFASNIIRYADRSVTVKAAVISAPESVTLSVSNFILPVLERSGSLGIGLRSVASLAKQMGASFCQSAADGVFRVQLSFPVQDFLSGQKPTSSESVRNSI